MWDHILPEFAHKTNWWMFSSRSRQSLKGSKWLDRDPQKEYNGLVIWYNPELHEWHAVVDIEGV